MLSFAQALQRLHRAILLDGATAAPVVPAPAVVQPVRQIQALIDQIAPS